MSEPTDQNPSEPMDDKDLSALYARGSSEQPSSVLDNAILDKARQATSKQASKTKDLSRWSNAVSIAAVLVVSVTLVMLVRKEAPEPTSITSQLDIVQDDMAAPLAKQLPERQKAETALGESREVPMTAMDSLALKKEMKAKQQRNEEERAMDKSIAASPALSLKQEAPAQATSSAETISPKAISPKTMAAGIVGGNAQESIMEGKSCSQLTEQECFSSAACTLTRNETGNGYQCRPAKDHCELLFRQSDGTKEICEAKAGCTYVPASCYCPPGVTCVCGGGEPAQCQNKKE